LRYIGISSAKLRPYSRPSSPRSESDTVANSHSIYASAVNVKTKVSHLYITTHEIAYRQPKMAETCRAPDGSEMWTFGISSKAKGLFIIGILGCLPMIVVLLGPKLLFWVGGMAAKYLKKKTEGRKGQILELTEKEEKEWVEKEGVEGQRRDSDEWENVDAYAVGSAKNGEKGEREWDGIVGFFHPFW